MPKKIIIPTMLLLAGTFVLSGCDNKINQVVEKDTENVNIIICDETGNRYTNEQEAKATGLSESQYGATYCQYFDENGNKLIEDDTDMTATNSNGESQAPAKIIPTTPKKTTPIAKSTEKFSKHQQVTGLKKHKDFILEHVKHNNANDKYTVAFKLDRKHDAKTHAAPYTVATYHAHDSKHNNGRIEVEIHEVNKNNFDPNKIVKPKHNKYIKNIEMGETKNETRALFIVHLNEKASGKFNLSSKVTNNQNVTITLDVLE